MYISLFFDHLIFASKESGRSITDILGEAKDHGLRAVDFYFHDIKTNPEYLDVAINSGIIVNSIYDFYHLAYDKNYNDAFHHIDVASSLNANALIVPGDFNEEDSIALNKLSKKEDIYEFFENSKFGKNALSGLSELSRYAKSKNVKPMIENFSTITSYTKRINELLWFFDNEPDLYFNLDCGNFNYVSESAFDIIPKLSERIANVHVKDGKLNPCNKDDFFKPFYQTAIGDGISGIDKIVEFLKLKNYNSGLSIEHYDVPNYTEAIFKSIDYLSGLIN